TRIGGVPRFPEKVYRADITPAFLVAHGVDPGEAGDNAGLHTLTFRHGRWRDHTDHNPTIQADCTGRYAVAKKRATVTLDAIPDGGSSAGIVLFNAAWSVSGDGLHLTDVTGPDDTPDLLLRTLFGGRPWAKIS